MLRAEAKLRHSTAQITSNPLKHLNSLKQLQGKIAASAVGRTKVPPDPVAPLPISWTEEFKLKSRGLR